MLYAVIGDAIYTHLQKNKGTLNHPLSPSVAHIPMNRGELSLYPPTDQHESYLACYVFLPVASL